MDLNDAVNAHVQWKVSLRRLLNGEAVQLKDPARDDVCELGKWFRAEGARHKPLPEFGAVISAHRQFHEIAGKIVSMAKSDKTGAERLLDGEFSQQSLKVVQAIGSLRAKLR